MANRGVRQASSRSISGPAPPPACRLPALWQDDRRLNLVPGWEDLLLYLLGLSVALPVAEALCQDVQRNDHVAVDRAQDASFGLECLARHWFRFGVLLQVQVSRRDCLS